MTLTTYRKNLLSFLFILTQTLLIGHAQSKIKPTCSFEQQMDKQGLINIQDLDASLLVELKYATSDNFMGKDVYGCLKHAFMQKKPATMLAEANRLLQKTHPNYRLLVYDAGRPASIQKILWNTLSQYSVKEREKYVANPAQGSIHNYGSAVDLTIATTDGKALDMGTKYDFFGDLAYPKKEAYFLKIGKLSRQQLDNRLLLRRVMKAVGFMPIEYEWWHFNAVSRKRAKQLYKIVE